MLSKYALLTLLTLTTVEAMGVKESRNDDANCGPNEESCDQDHYCNIEQGTCLDRTYCSDDEYCSIYENCIEIADDRGDFQLGCEEHELEHCGVLSFCPTGDKCMGGEFCMTPCGSDDYCIPGEEECVDDLEEGKMLCVIACGYEYCLPDAEECAEVDGVFECISKEADFSTGMGNIKEAAQIEATPCGDGMCFPGEEECVVGDMGKMLCVAVEVGDFGKGSDFSTGADQIKLTPCGDDSCFPEEECVLGDTGKKFCEVVEVEDFGNGSDFSTGIDFSNGMAEIKPAAQIKLTPCGDDSCFPDEECVLGDTGKKFCEVVEVEDFGNGSDFSTGIDFSNGMAEIKPAAQIKLTPCGDDSCFPDEECVLGEFDEKFCEIVEGGGDFDVIDDEEVECEDFCHVSAFCSVDSGLPSCYCDEEVVVEAGVACPDRVEDDVCGNNPCTIGAECVDFQGSYLCLCNGLVLAKNEVCDEAVEDLCEDGFCDESAYCLLDEEAGALCYCDNGFQVTQGESCENSFDEDFGYFNDEEQEVDVCSTGICGQNQCSSYGEEYVCSCHGMYDVDPSYPCNNEEEAPVVAGQMFLTCDDITCGDHARCGMEHGDPVCRCTSNGDFEGGDFNCENGSNGYVGDHADGCGTVKICGDGAKCHHMAAEEGEEEDGYYCTCDAADTDRVTLVGHYEDCK
jgi:hypothetical protein